ncbi:hypothetical protein B0J15DRAFT_89596 [Fusarium solani]|uniref:PD-(D/E)XK nuclease-like domain-containing protein n=1 Tax=Fusarium solani TaxID=169388 RepID=A0A9P9GQC9_FUSSL|nr:uncharacterized protein B0J15DRAFT_89596 [Fusarium solani]KAH7243798.1 hypothetical protein B0J15DRAFT_89596 [Fusarium solani]
MPPLNFVGLLPTTRSTIQATRPYGLIPSRSALKPSEAANLSRRHSCRWGSGKQLNGSSCQSSLEMICTSYRLFPAYLSTDMSGSLWLHPIKMARRTLWTGGTFGSTETPLKTFQAITGVRRLRTWSLEVFWPWYKAYVLKVPATSVSVPSG